MTVFEILEQKAFTGQLFVGELFDPFPLCDGEVVTSCTVRVDGRLQRSFFDSDARKELERTGREYTYWKDQRPFFLTLIRGKRLPVRFRLTLQVPDEVFSSEKSGASAHYLNIQYKDQKLYCTTGVSYTAFVPDKQGELAFDDAIREFFSRHHIAYQRL